MIDEPGEVRAGDELDLGAVDAWLRARLPELRGAPRLRQYPGGASNLTYLLSYDGRDLVLRRPPIGHKAKSAHDMGREVRIVTALRPVFPAVPTVVAHCTDPAVLGCEFYLMDRVLGWIPRRSLPEGFDPARTRLLCQAAVDQLIALHQVDPDRAGLREIGRGPGYVRRQVEGWTDRYRKARTPDVPDFERVMAWLAEHQPAQDAGAVVLHGDFRFDNLVLDPADPTRVLAVLDWEMATIGDPLADLGNALAYWVQADDEPQFRSTARQPTTAPGMWTRAEVVAYYASRTGTPVDQFAFYEVFGLFRLAVIAQQIYYRFFHGQTTNPQYGAFGPLVGLLERRCAAAGG
ncbi:MAG: phosphotransferase family protein [Myxococcota bacterium]